MANAILFTTTSTSSADVYGIYHLSTSNCNINKVVARISTSNMTTANLVFYGLRRFAGSSQINVFDTNTVGTASASIKVSSSRSGSRIIDPVGYHNNDEKRG